MAQVIVYENGNAIGGEGHPTYARDITFENEGTDLEAETAQAAIVEVNEKTKHGNVELWKNTSPTSDMAGQTISFSNKGYDLDAIEVSFGFISGSQNRLIITGTVTIDVDGKAELTYYAITSQSKTQYFSRTAEVSISNGNINIIFSDCTCTAQNAIGSAPATTTTNSVCVPMRILGVLKEN